MRGAEHNILRKKSFKALLMAALTGAVLVPACLLMVMPAIYGEALAAPAAPNGYPQMPSINIPGMQQIYNNNQRPNDIPTHMDPMKNPGGCSACHAAGGGQRSCLGCHGPNKGDSRGMAVDIDSLRYKPSVHPFWTTGGLYSRYNQGPELNPINLRHVSCLDCHNPHEETSADPTAGAMGYSAMRRTGRASQEYEVCFRCHSDSVNKPAGAENLREVFSPTNVSYHPIEIAGKNAWVPSLKAGYTTASTIKCTDCHGNSNPYGPKGPHASDYPPLLAKQYIMHDGPESTQAYDLCYGCHDRNSILGDKSFQAHKFHIVYDQESCHDCHDAHGTQMTTFLINFDTTIVTNGSDGGPFMLANQQGRPYCYLKCHGVDHNMNRIQGPTGTMKWPW